ncbi:hypothetical protein IWQ62_001612 [Dispira parvispora]|uniref:Uncharacterized protein n=1 Tax=Dispira parvispora TaxID=1520584 RepID=A0A9W8AXF8_9FUNG|nr:hypothetical protein IWQ62_001612 [Dispira parvispora]
MAFVLAGLFTHCTQAAEKPQAESEDKAPEIKECYFQPPCQKGSDEECSRNCLKIPVDEYVQCRDKCFAEDKLGKCFVSCVQAVRESKEFSEKVKDDLKNKATPTSDEEDGTDEDAANSAASATSSHKGKHHSTVSSSSGRHSKTTSYNGVFPTIELEEYSAASSPYLVNGLMTSLATALMLSGLQQLM